MADKIHKNKKADSTWLSAFSVKKTKIFNKYFLVRGTALQLLHRDAFCKISWLVNIGTLNDRHMVCKELQGYNHKDGG